ncbi:hypothetical protein JTB14_023045 [Gonioctena quinquepunctata]|nr:hypothetical protein JTB14_009078 [Gonioctena quinquepunctata]KAG5861136.1 hypothetical protein JTB14_023045 [Gonioctena quinquepunctata]
MSSHMPAVMTETVPSGTVFKNEPSDSPTYKNGRIMEFLANKLSLFQEKPGSARDMPRHIRLNFVTRMPSQSHGTRMKDPADLKHKLATPFKELTRMVNHSPRHSRIHSRRMVISTGRKSSAGRRQPWQSKMTVHAICWWTRTSAGDADTLVTSDNPVAKLGRYSAHAEDDVEFVPWTVHVANALVH